MITEQVRVPGWRGKAQPRANSSSPRRLAEVIAIARAWDNAPGDRLDLAPPRGGWVRCFECAAARGFEPREPLSLSE
jgi:hypothetical protein